MSEKKSLVSLDSIANSVNSACTKTAIGPENWNSPNCGDIGLAIQSNGTWTFKGSTIQRLALIKLFSTVLYREKNGSTYLKTPYEKIVVAVADAAFIAVALEIKGEGKSQTLQFRTNVDEMVEAGPKHPLRFQIDPMTGAIKPYLSIRSNLEALLTREVTRQLLNLVDDDLFPGIWSGGRFFKIPSLVPNDMHCS